MKMPRRRGWPWKLICHLPGWALKIRLAVLKKCEQSSDVKDEISDCEFQLSYIFFYNAWKKSKKRIL